MLSIVKSMSLIGLEGYLINVQVDVSAGIPCWEIVGLPDTSVKESKERVRTAVKNSGYELLSRRVVVNLAPADIKKEGSFFDLPIAIGTLMCCEEIKENQIEDTVFVGELSLDGTINKINGVLPQDTFFVLLRKYEKEKKEYDKNIIKAKMKTKKNNESINREEFSIIMNELLKFDTITEENKSIVFKLIDKIIIDDRNINIKYKFKTT